MLSKMDPKLLIKMSIIILAALLGLYYTMFHSTVEAFNNNNAVYRCPNLLIQKGIHYYLYNSNLAKVPGVNPVKFNSLEDYVEFTDWQRSQGIRCPVLYVQESYDTQGNMVYKARSSIDNLQGGLQDFNIGAPPTTKLFDASRNDAPYNSNGYPGFDSQDQYVGLNTPLDQMFQESGNKTSPNPMDPTWGGQEYTQGEIDKGNYAEDEVLM